MARVQGTKVKVPTPKGSFPNPAELVARSVPVLSDKRLPPVPAVPQATPEPFPAAPVKKISQAFQGAGPKDDTRLLATADPTITGASLHTGGVLTWHGGTWQGDDVTVTRQWVRADDAAGTNQANIVGETGTTYTIVAGDAGKYIAVVETATEQRNRKAESSSQQSAFTGPAVNP